MLQITALRLPWSYPGKLIKINVCFLQSVTNCMCAGRPSYRRSVQDRQRKERINILWLWLFGSALPHQPSEGNNPVLFSQYFCAMLSDRKAVASFNLVFPLYTPMPFLPHCSYFSRRTGVGCQWHWILLNDRSYPFPPSIPFVFIK